MDKIRRSYCGLCHPRCGTLLHYENGKVIKVTGDPEHPVTKGAICERGRLMVDHLYPPFCTAVPGRQRRGKLTDRPLYVNRLCVQKKCQLQQKAVTDIFIGQPFPQSM